MKPPPPPNGMVCRVLLHDVAIVTTPPSFLFLLPHRCKITSEALEEYRTGPVGRVELDLKTGKVRAFMVGTLSSCVIRRGCNASTTTSH